MSDATEKLGVGPRGATSTRRRWSKTHKRRIVAESYRSEDSVAAVARRNAVNPSVLFTWRRRFREQLDSGGFVPVVVSKPGDASLVKESVRSGEVDDGVAPTTGRMEIVLGGEVRVVVDATVDGAALARVVAVVAGR